MKNIGVKVVIYGGCRASLRFETGTISIVFEDLAINSVLFVEPKRRPR